MNARTDHPDRAGAAGAAGSTDSATAPSSALETLARRMGVQRRYLDGMGRRRTAPTDTVLTVLQAMGLDVRRPEDAADALRRLDAEAARQLCEPVSVIWRNRDPLVTLGPGIDVAAGAAIELTMIHEHGEATPWRTDVDGLHRPSDGRPQVRLPAMPPSGRHRLRVAADGRTAEAIVLVAPPRSYLREEGTELALFLALHGVRSDRDLGIGSYGDLERLADWAGRRGASAFGTLPLLATFLDEPFDPSPYAPVSRCIFSELHLDVHAAAAATDEPLPTLRALLDDADFRRATAEVRARPLVDHRASWALVRRCLDAAADDVRADPTLTSAVAEFARRRPLVADYARFRGEHAPEGRDPAAERHLFLVAQWLLTDQLARASSALGPDGGLYLDLPIGTHPQGFDAWREPELHARGISLGVPPDEFFRHGQTWGFPPVIPEVSRRQGHRTFAAAVAAHLEHAEALRIDHAAGLYRCFWTPDGASPDDGLYVHQPAEELLALLSIHSHQRRATLIAEDLGTVPQAISRDLHRRGMLNMDILQFGLGEEAEPLPVQGGRTLVSLNTHDMPRFAAFWHGEDIDRHAELGILDDHEVAGERERRAARRDRVVAALRAAGRLASPGDTGPSASETPDDADAPDDTDAPDDMDAPDAPDAPDDAAILEAILAHAAEAGPSILLVDLEDLWGEHRPQNVPGTTGDQHPNWRHRSARTLDRILDDPSLDTILGRLGGGGRPAPPE